jgi:hypothetical protein
MAQHQQLNSPYSNQITVEVELESGRKRSISGSVFGVVGKIVQIDNYKSFPAFKPEGTLLRYCISSITNADTVSNFYHCCCR